MRDFPVRESRRRLLRTSASYNGQVLGERTEHGRSGGSARARLPSVARQAQFAAMTETITADICIVGAGPVGGTLACRLAAEGIATTIVDRAPLPPMEHPAFDGRAYAIAAGSRRLLEAAGLWDKLPEPACPILDSRLGRPARAARLADVPAFRPSRGRRRGWAVRLDGRGTRAARGAERAHARLVAARVFAPAEARVERDAAGARVHVVGWPDDRVQAGGRGGRAAVAAPRSGPHPGQPHSVSSDGACVRDQSRAPAPQHGARTLPAVRPFRAAADERDRGLPACLGGGLDRAHPGRAADVAAR